MNAKNPNTIPGPIQLKRNGIRDGIIAARTQWVETPNDWP